MRPPPFSKSRAFEGRAHGGLRVTFPCGQIPRRFRAMAQRESLRYETLRKHVGPPILGGDSRVGCKPLLERLPGLLDTSAPRAKPPHEASTTRGQHFSRDLCFPKNTEIHLVQELVSPTTTTQLEAFFPHEIWSCENNTTRGLFVFQRTRTSSCSRTGFLRNDHTT